MEDTIGDFFSLLGMDNPIVNSLRENTGMSRELVQLYEAVPGLRTEHREETHSILDEQKESWRAVFSLGSYFIRRATTDSDVSAASDRGVEYAGL